MVEPGGGCAPETGAAPPLLRSTSRPPTSCEAAAQANSAQMRAHASLCTPGQVTRRARRAAPYGHRAARPGQLRRNEARGAASALQTPVRPWSDPGPAARARARRGATHAGAPPRLRGELQRTCRPAGAQAGGCVRTRRNTEPGPASCERAAAARMRKLRKHNSSVVLLSAGRASSSHHEEAARAAVQGCTPPRRRSC